MGKYNTTLRSHSLSLREAGNGRGVDNTAASAAKGLGYQVDEASASSKFVQVSGPEGTTLLGYYGGFGGYQIELPSEAARAEFLAEVKGAKVAYGTQRPRVALGHDKADLAKALEVVCGKVGEKVEKVEVAAPLAALKAPVVQAPALDITGITVAALAAGKSTDEVLAIIAALKA
jgi:hypothetical protein